MDITTICLIAVLIILLVEVRLSLKWATLYFCKGIKIYHKEIRFQTTLINTDDLIIDLNESFKSSGLSPSIYFRKISSQTVGFREKLFEFSLLSYTPIMHGKIETSRSHIIVTGLANWYPIAFTCLWYVILIPSFNHEVDLMFVVMPVIVFGVIYMIQAKKYRAVVAQLSKIKEQNKQE